MIEPSTRRRSLFQHLLNSCLPPSRTYSRPDLSCVLKPAMLFWRLCLRRVPDSLLLHTYAALRDGRRNSYRRPRFILVVDFVPSYTNQVRLDARQDLAHNARSTRSIVCHSGSRLGALHSRRARRATRSNARDERKAHEHTQGTPSLSVRHRKSSICALACAVWCSLAWAYFWPPLPRKYEQKEDVGDGLQRPLQLVHIARMVGSCHTAKS
jgi:hypothetical protein